MTPASPARIDTAASAGLGDGGRSTARAAASTELQRLVAGINPLLGAANVLLALVAKLRATTAHADPPELRRQLLERVEEFEANARAGGLQRPKIVAARYVLCSFIDEVAASTPWGAGGVWGERTLLQEFHEEAWGGDKAFKLLERMGEDVAANADLLELFYVCLALGFEGRYRGKPKGQEQLRAIADRLLATIRPKKGQPDERTLSLRWTGLTMPERSRSWLPLWVVLAVGALILVGAVLMLNARLNAQSTPLFTQILALPASLRSNVLDRQAEARPRLAPLLNADVAAGSIAVRDEALRSVVVLPADGFFVSGTARLDARSADVLNRIAAALAQQPGQIVVVGHTDDQVPNSVQFPSAWHLSFERAATVAQALAQAGAGNQRLRAEGRAEAEPVAANDSADGRRRNRRVEIELLLPRPQG